MSLLRLQSHVDNQFHWLSEAKGHSKVVGVSDKLTYSIDRIASLSKVHTNYAQFWSNFNHFVQMLWHMYNVEFTYIYFKVHLLCNRNLYAMCCICVFMRGV